MGTKFDEAREKRREDIARIRATRAARQLEKGNVESARRIIGGGESGQRAYEALQEMSPELVSDSGRTVIQGPKRTGLSEEEIRLETLKRRRESDIRAGKLQPGTETLKQLAPGASSEQLRRFQQVSFPLTITTQAPETTTRTTTKFPRTAEAFRIRAAEEREEAFSRAPGLQRFFPTVKALGYGAGEFLYKAGEVKVGDIPRIGATALATVGYIATDPVGFYKTAQTQFRREPERFFGPALIPLPFGKTRTLTVTRPIRFLEEVPTPSGLTEIGIVTKEGQVLSDVFVTPTTKFEFGAVGVFQPKLFGFIPIGRKRVVAVRGEGLGRTLESISPDEFGAIAARYYGQTSPLSQAKLSEVEVGLSGALTRTGAEEPLYTQAIGVEKTIGTGDLGSISLGEMTPILKTPEAEFLSGSAFVKSVKGKFSEYKFFQQYFKRRADDVAFDSANLEMDVSQGLQLQDVFAQLAVSAAQKEATEAAKISFDVPQLVPQLGFPLQQPSKTGEIFKERERFFPSAPVILPKVSQIQIESPDVVSGRRIGLGSASMVAPGTGTTPITIPIITPIVEPIVGPKPITTPITTPIQRPVTRQRTALATAFPRMPTPKLNIPGGGFVPFMFPSFKGKMPRSFGGFRLAREFAISPSIAAIGLDITGPGPLRLEAAGFGLRPIPTKRRGGKRMAKRRKSTKRRRRRR